MPSIDITPEQAERLAAVQEELAADVVGKYGHVRVQDAIEYLLDEYESGHIDGDVDGDGDREPTATTEPTAEATVDEGKSTDSSDAATSDSGTNPAPDGSDGDAMLNAMMNLLDTHDDKWGESTGDERYEVTLPDGEVERVRTKDDVRALLFKHYR